MLAVDWKRKKLLAKFCFRDPDRMSIFQFFQKLRVFTSMGIGYSENFSRTFGSPLCQGLRLAYLALLP